jgi:hypothetical protein
MGLTLSPLELAILRETEQPRTLAGISVDLEPEFDLTHVRSATRALARLGLLERDGDTTFEIRYVRTNYGQRTMLQATLEWQSRLRAAHTPYRHLHVVR